MNKTFPKACLFVIFSAPALFGAQPKALVWDPETKGATPRAEVSPESAVELCRALRSAGGFVQTITADAMCKRSRELAADADALFFAGVGFPLRTVEPIKAFLDAGGVLVSCEDRVPFLIGLANDSPDRLWRLSPEEPKFAWQTDEILSYIGLTYRYDPSRHSQGVLHQPTPLLSRFSPGLKEIRGRLDSMWVVPVPGARYTPLFRSLRSDGKEVPGPLYLISYKGRNAIVCTSPLLLMGRAPETWPDAEKLRRGVLLLAAALRKDPGLVRTSDVAELDLSAPGEPRTPMDRISAGGVDPEGVPALVRWGRFDGSSMDLGAPLPSRENQVIAAGAGMESVPRRLDAGSSVTLGLPDGIRQEKGANCYFRLRGAYAQSDTGLKVSVGDTVLWNERLRYIDTRQAANFSRSLSGEACQFTRVVFVPRKTLEQAKSITLSNPGANALTLDAFQLEQRTSGRGRCIGLGAGQEDANNYPATESQRWGGLRTSLRTQHVGAPGTANRFAALDAKLRRLLAKKAPIQPILEGTPDWAAIGKDRLADAQKARRPTTVPPDPELYCEIVKEVVARYGSHFECYEIWNEADIEQFYRGTASEYVDLFHRLSKVIRQYDSSAKIMPSGMAGFNVNFIQELDRGGVLAASDRVAFHPYAGKSSAWDLPYGILEGELFSRGYNTEIFCNESGFPCNNQEWFSPPPDWDERQQAHAVDVAIARVLASGLSKLSVFHAGGDNHGFGMFRADGTARPVYEVFSDYLSLQGPGATRLDVSAVRADGRPLEGVYVAGSRHGDGHCAVVVNPAESPDLQVPTPIRLPISNAARWTSFFGDARYDRDGVWIDPQAGKTAGFYRHVQIDLAKNPMLETEVVGDGVQWELMLKRSGGRNVSVVPRRGEGSVRVDLRTLGRDFGGEEDVEVSFRISGESARLREVSFRPDGDGAKSQGVDIVLRVPVTAVSKDAVSAVSKGDPVACRVARSGDSVEVKFSLVARTVVSFAAK